MSAPKLTMASLLSAIEDHGLGFYYYRLRLEGFHPNVITAKAEKAERRGYVDNRYLGGLTPKAHEFMERCRRQAP